MPEFRVVSSDAEYGGMAVVKVLGFHMSRFVKRADALCVVVELENEERVSFYATELFYTDPDTCTECGEPDGEHDRCCNYGYEIWCSRVDEAYGED